MKQQTHKWIDGRCECGCELGFANIKGKGKCRIYSFDGFKTRVVGSPACTRSAARINKIEYMRRYRDLNKAKISAYAKLHYLKKKAEMIKQVLQPV